MKLLDVVGIIIGGSIIYIFFILLNVDIKLIYLLLLVFYFMFDRVENGILF